LQSQFPCICLYDFFFPFCSLLSLNMKCLLTRDTGCNCVCSIGRIGQSQWPYILRHGSAAACLSGSLVQILLTAWMFVVLCSL
jgi:hypothetical protein